MGSTMLALVFCADLHQDTTYHDVLRSMCGKRAQQLAAASIMFTCFGINVTFLVIIGDQFDRCKYYYYCFQMYATLISFSLSSVLHIYWSQLLRNNMV